jgi:hypothetical protein
LSQSQRNTVIDLCERLDSLQTLAELADVIGSTQARRSTASMASQ